MEASSPSKDYARLGALFALAVAAYALCLRFVFPGYFDPLVPVHSDLFTVPGLSVDRWPVTAYAHWPRPAGFLVADVLGRLGLRPFLFSIVLLALADVALTMWLVRRMAGRKFDAAVAAGFVCALFAHPSFYLNYLHDVLATLSYFYLVLAMHAWYSYRETGRRRYVVAVVALFALLAFTKETYFAAAGALWVAQFLVVKPERRKVCLGLLAALGVFELASLYDNAHSINPFLALASDPSSPYYISLAPRSVAATFRFYALRVFNPATLALALAGVAWTARRRERLIMSASLLLAGLCALLPHCVVPNHVEAMYAWVGFPLALAPMLFLQPSGRAQRAAVWCGVAALVAGSIALNQPRYKENAWAILQEKANRNFMASYRLIKRLPAEDRRILITGVRAPYNPFRLGDYVRFEFGSSRQWTVVVPRDVAESSDGLVKMVRPERVNLADYDYAFSYRDDGVLERTWSRKELRDATGDESAGISRRDLALFPELAGIAIRLRAQPEDWEAVLRAGIVFWNWGALEKAAETLQHSAELIHYQNPYPMFFLGQVREAQGIYVEARKLFEQAIALGPNPAFNEALERVKKEEGR